MSYWLLQKKKKNGNKLYYVFYLVNGNVVLSRLGYIMYINDVTIVRIKLQEIFIFLYFYQGFLTMREHIYLKFFIISYFYLLEVKKWN